MTQQRFESLDSLRGLAAITVVLQHFNNDYAVFTAALTPFFYYSPFHIPYDGKAAVDFFFVLSGFVLSYKFVKDGFKDFGKLNYVSYLIARIFRIYPLPIMVISFSALAALYIPLSFNGIPHANVSSTIWEPGFHLKFFLKQISLIGIDENSLHNYAPQTWTLKTEMIVSAFVPFMILIARYRVTWLAVFTFILIFLFQVSYFIMLFSMGIILAVYMPEVNKYMEGKSRGFKVSVLLAGLCLYSYRFSIVPYFHEGSFLQNVFGDGDQAGLPWGFFMNLMIGFGVVLILAISLNSATLKSILHHSIMRLLGRISYSIYLCHYLLLILIIPRIVLMLNNAGMSDRSTIILIAFLSTLALTFGLSYLLYYTVERFGMSMGKKVISLYAATFNKAKSYK